MTREELARLRETRTEDELVALLCDRVLACYDLLLETAPDYCACDELEVGDEDQCLYCAITEMTGEEPG